MACILSTSLLQVYASPSCSPHTETGVRPRRRGGSNAELRDALHGEKEQGKKDEEMRGNIARWPSRVVVGSVYKLLSSPRLPKLLS